MKGQTATGTSINRLNVMVNNRNNKTGNVRMKYYEALSHNHCRHGKSINITYFECVSVALVIQPAKRIRLLYCHLWPIGLYHIIPYYLINGTILGK